MAEASPQNEEKDLEDMEENKEEAGDGVKNEAAGRTGLPGRGLDSLLIRGSLLPQLKPWPENAEVGEVVDLVAHKAFGFIRVVGDRRQIFFHRRHVINCCRLDVELRVGSRLKFSRAPPKAEVGGADGQTQQKEGDQKERRKGDHKLEASAVFVNMQSDLDKSRQAANGWTLGKVVVVLPKGGYLLLGEKAGPLKERVLLGSNFMPKCMPLLQVGDEVQFMVFTHERADKRDKNNKPLGPRARRVQVLRYKPRACAELQEFLGRLTKGVHGALPSATLTQLLAARPLWQLLLSAAEVELESPAAGADADASPDEEEAVVLGDMVLGLMTRVLSEAVTRMRGTARRLARDLLELPFFGKDGPLARHIQELVLQRRQIAEGEFLPALTEEEIEARLISIRGLLESLLAAEPGLAYRLHGLVGQLSLYGPSLHQQAWLHRMFELAASFDNTLLAEPTWDRLYLIPGAEELKGTPLEDNTHLRAVRREAPYSSEEEYMDTYFRLLRADCFAAIQRGIKSLLKGELDERDMKVFYNIRLVGCHSGEGGGEGGLQLDLRFETTQRVRRWEAFSSLMYGNLVCLSPRGRFEQADVIWALVSERDTGLLSSKSGPTILIKLLTEFNIHSDTEVIVLLTRAAGTTVMVESPQYFTAFRHVLDTLQKFDMERFPLKQEIVFCHSEDSQPEYLTPESKVADLSLKKSTVKKTKLLGYQSELPAATVEVADMADMLANSGLDPSQQAALAHALTHRLAIIQGPPGCGKTYIGIKLVELLLSMEPPPRTPILVLTYKNHALDEFLKGLLAFLELDEMVRIGGRSRELELESCNIRNIDRNCMDHSIKDQINSLRDDIRAKNTAVTAATLALQEASVLNIQDLLEVCSEEQLRIFLLCAPYGKDAIRHKLTRGKFANKETVRKLLDKIPAVREVLRSGGGNDKNNKEANQVCQLFWAVFGHWAPPASCFSQLKDLQQQFVNRIRVSQESHNDALQDDEPEDEEVVEGIVEARLAAQGKRLKRSDEAGPRIRVAMFRQNQGSSGRLASLQDFPPNMESNEQVLSVDSFWGLNNVEKIGLFYTVLNQKIEEFSVTLCEQLEELDSMIKSLDELQAQMKAEVLKTKKIIGMTITGASIHHELIQEVAPAIVIVEEAAEVLEADLLAALTPGLQHLVLIGDHKQLRPKVDTYKLRKEYNFDLSMMERLIGNQFPFKTLLTQNRMRPEFSKLLRDIYPKLQDNLARVEKNRPAECLVRSMCFWNHNEQEKDGRSLSNIEEARRAVCLAKFLQSTGIGANQITILAAYQGQVAAIRTLMRGPHGGPSTGQNESGGKSSRQREDRVQINTIDMFQGDENDFIIVSLVRCNARGAIGFLAEQSRRCVAQSRARCGMFIIGSAATLMHRSSSSWNWLLESMMKDEGCLTDALALQCAKHQEKSVTHIPDAETFEQLIRRPETLCQLVCGEEYPCHLHTCTKPCMPAHAHGSCTTLVKFVHPRCGHNGQKRCYEVPGTVPCSQAVLLQFSVCGHTAMVKCHRKREHDTHVKFKKCSAKVVCELPACGHTVTKLCSTNLSDVICKSVVYYKGGCGHDLSRECHVPPGQVVCNFRPCAKPRRCGHPCVNSCGQDCDQGDCAACQLEQEVRLKKNRHRAKMRAKKLREEIAERGAAFSRQTLQDKDPEYMSVYDRVTKYILPMHNWFPHVTRIEKVYNPTLEAKYEDYKATAFGDHEDLKFHGTDDAGVEGITKEGFRIGKPGMYGAGIYFATDSSKSSQLIYTKNSNKLLLCKVLLGRAKTVHSADKNLSGKGLQAGKFDSVFAPRNTKGSGGVLNDEFVVFDTRQAVVQYVIHYASGGLSGGALAQLASATPGKSFQKVRMVPGRTVNLQDPLELTYRFAEGHFLRMAGKYGATGRHTINAITIVNNPKLAAKFEAKQEEFSKKNKGDIIFAYHGTQTDSSILNNILENNFEKKFWGKKTGQVYGPGTYFSEFPNISIVYGFGLILCQLLPGREYKGDSNKPKEYDSRLVSPDAASGSAQMVIIEDADQILPFCVIHLSTGPNVTL